MVLVLRSFTLGAGSGLSFQHIPSVFQGALVFVGSALTQCNYLLFSELNWSWFMYRIRNVIITIVALILNIISLKLSWFCICVIEGKFLFAYRCWFFFFRFWFDSLLFHTPLMENFTPNIYSAFFPADILVLLYWRLSYLDANEGFSEREKNVKAFRGSTLSYFTCSTFYLLVYFSVMVCPSCSF